ncbi:MAG: thylakoid membrane photosystem I accumulation factor [Cyanobacterium sp. T60_A2020_053]|nr:thylakoid membrane photosystem I accumulation factor [Cyanobacterium sp. T60_A2020_053]
MVIKSFSKLCLIFALSIALWFSNGLGALAEIDNDRLDGNIFVVYAGNGSLVPPRLTLKQSFDRELPVILVYYLDDNSDSKQFAFIVSRLQEFYGRTASIMPINVDTITPKDKYQPDEVGYYYEGAIPQTVILNQNREVIFNEKGVIEFEQADDVLRKLFDLLPRSESVQLRKKTFNQFNSELVPDER